MTVSEGAGKVLIREMLEKLSDPGAKNEWAGVVKIFHSLDMNQRIHLVYRIINILQLSNGVYAGKRRL